MRLIPQKIEQDLHSGVSHLCYCWHITRADGQRLGLTNHDQPVQFLDTVFHADSGIDLSALDARLGLAQQGPTAAGILASRHLSKADLQAGAYDEAAFQLYLVDWQAPENRVLLMQGQFGPVTYSDQRFSVALRGTGQQLNQLQGRIYQAQCDAVLGDGRCRLDVTQAAYQWRGAITSIDADFLILPKLPFAEGWFQHGVVITPAGRALPIRFDETRHEARYIQLWQSEISDLKAANEVSLVAGCDKQLATCRHKFANAINFQGFPTLGDDTLLVSVKPA